MSDKYLVTLNKPADAQRVRDSGVAVLAEYPDSMLVRCTPQQQQTLRQAQVEMTELKERPVQLAGLSFNFAAAMEAERASPSPARPPGRRAYYLVQMIGPAMSEWLDQLRAAGGSVQGNADGFSLIVGATPDQMQKVRAFPWIEAVTPYRPAMKVSPKLRGMPRVLGAPQLEAVDMPAAAPPQQIEISVFPGESTATVAAEVRAAGGMVLRETRNVVTATVPSQALPRLASEPGVQAIVPYVFPKLHNDRAAQIMGVPANRSFGGAVLRGANQTVAVADSGLDTGDPASLHRDLRGRVIHLESFPLSPGLQFLTNDPPGSNDGPADVFSGHGTHVAGSVLGDGAEAAAAASPFALTGVAPEAQLYFQAVEQRVHWKSRAQLIADGIPPQSIPIDWPPSPVTLGGLPDDLRTLFQPAYAAGARIHTNSWGSAVAGNYTSEARQVDDFLWTHRDMLILFSAGNEGVDNDDDGVVDVDSIGSPATAKNCLTVGASENHRPSASNPPPGIDRLWTQWAWPMLVAAGHVSDNPDGMAAFSSRGPTDDGRIKPDVVAPGTNVLSTRSAAFNNPDEPVILWGDLAATHPLRGFYCWSGGTSMSTPLVAGAAALVRQYLVDERGHFEAGVKPSGALLKAMIVNGAVSMPGHADGEIPSGANSVNGFGRVHVSESLLPGLQQVLFADEPSHAVASGEMRVFRLQNVQAGRPLKVTLVWTDAPSPIGSGTLQNRLYLQVRRPDGVVVDGDVTPFPSATNNVQQVNLLMPAAGTYEVRVRGVSVTQQSPGAPSSSTPRQDFAVVASNGSGLALI